MTRLAPRIVIDAIGATRNNTLFRRCRSLRPCEALLHTVISTERSEWRNLAYVNSGVNLIIEISPRGLTPLVEMTRGVVINAIGATRNAKAAPRTGAAF